MRRGGAPKDLGASLGNLVRSLDRASGGGWQQIRVNEAWSEVAGPTVMEHTADVHLRTAPRELVVAVDSPVWATELSALSALYLEKLNEVLGQKAVKSIRFTVSRKVVSRREDQQSEAEHEEFYAPDPIEPAELSAVEVAQVEQSAAEIPDEELRRAVVSATLKDLALKKARRMAKSRQTPPQGL
jgi:hypothetical protein